jgi:hypothetical protein
MLGNFHSLAQIVQHTWKYRCICIVQHLAFHIQRRSMWPFTGWGSADLRLTLHSSAQSMVMRLRDGDVVTFRIFCQQVMDRCQLSPWLIGGHMQTLWTLVSQQKQPVYYSERYSRPVLGRLTDTLPSTSRHLQLTEISRTRERKLRSLLPSPTNLIRTGNFWTLDPC